MTNPTTTAAAKAGHTAEPWIHEPGDRYVREDSTGGTIGLVCEDDGHAHPGHRRDYPRDANAARIVECVNALAGVSDPAAFRASHDALLAALQEAIEIIHIHHGEPGWAEYQQSPEMRRFRAAIALAKKGPTQ